MKRRFQYTLPFWIGEGKFQFNRRPDETIAALVPWRAARPAKVGADKEHQHALAEKRLADLKATLEDMRAQQDAWLEMAQARNPPRLLDLAVAVAALDGDEIGEMGSPALGWLRTRENTAAREAPPVGSVAGFLY